MKAQDIKNMTSEEKRNYGILSITNEDLQRLGLKYERGQLYRKEGNRMWKKAPTRIY